MRPFFSCGNCAHLTFEDLSQGIGRCGKYRKAVNTMSSEACHSEYHKPIQVKEKETNQLTLNI